MRALWAMRLAPAIAACRAHSLRFLLNRKPSSLPSASNDVDHRENHNPNRVHKMPIETENIHALGMLALDISKQCEQQDRQESKQAHHHVESMQSDQRKVSGPKQVGLNRESLVINQMSPLNS